MTTYIRGLEGKLNDILTILGTTKTLLVPGWENTGSLVSAIGVAGFTSSDENGAVTLQAELAPVQMPCGLYHYGFVTSQKHNFVGVDNDAFSFGTGAADAQPFSAGMWVRPNLITTAQDFMAKYRTTAAAAREWRWGMTNAGLMQFELYDESADTTEIGTATSALTPGAWALIVVTYDGVDATPGVHLYINTDDVLTSGATTETGAYVAMENLTTPLLIGASDITTAPANGFGGRMALPFLCGKALTAAEVASLFALTAPMVGLV